ncbi:MAG: zinc ribbon domain-containing protein, partial [Thermoplasmata archaeon]|nr:zinc ribbon domain-containing protein [Thermoplasmata archaeon]
MAYRILLSDGSLFCSICKAPVTATSSVCGSCGASLVDTLVGKRCPSCGTPLPEKAKECPKCGLVFKTEEPPTDDEEFLSRLLEWGKKVADRTETLED